MMCSRRLLLVAVAVLGKVVDARYCGASNCYEVLGVGQKTASSGIKKAWEKLSKKYKEKGDTTKLYEVETAYQILADGPLKAAYDYELKHPEEGMNNLKKYLVAAYLPKEVQVWMVLLGLFIIITPLQLLHFKEKKKTFLNSPAWAALLEDEYLANCSRGRQGYQSGELTPERKAEIRKAFIEDLKQDPDCPLYGGGLMDTAIPQLFCLPVKIVRGLSSVKDAQAERRAQDEELRKEAEAEDEAAAEAERIAQEKAEHKAIKAQILADKKKAEEEKKRRWAEEAQREAEEEESEEDDKDLVVDGKVLSVDELKKKGQYLIEVRYGGGDCVQIVTDKVVKEGQQVTVGLEGHTLEDGKKVKRSKIAGEWSEGVVLKLGAAPSSPDPVEVPEAVEEEMEQPEAADKKAVQRKKNKK
eukprot:TRINITY_DN80337_c0_g1_i1.p1 TRINITY_DN80337_c0_g1~~TRINITY_DN80337_c0_g1_i1.p1  ORF type:complete len:414 (+),score=130.92 TRINITY_DN80337_c0_g1_i1:32-1273(+)